MEILRIARRKMLARLAVLWCVALSLGLAARSDAFNFNEHRQIDYDAVDLLAPANRQLLRERETAELAILDDRSRTAMQPIMQRVGVPTSFSGADVSAMAGDLSTDPANLMARFFSLGGTARSPRRRSRPRSLQLIAQSSRRHRPRVSRAISRRLQRGR